MTALRRIACIAALMPYSVVASSADGVWTNDAPRCQVWQRELGFA